MLCCVYCGACVGIEALTVTIEVDVTIGISYFLVGLPDSAVRESQQRVGAALSTIGARLPGKRIVINMAPADLKKEGSAYDLPIALGILAASGQYQLNDIDKFLIMGELALDGKLRPIKGALPIAIHAMQEGFKGCIFPKESAYEVTDIDGIDVYGVSTLQEAISVLSGEGKIKPMSGEFSSKESVSGEERGLYGNAGYDFADIRGQENAKRGLEIAAAGFHNVIMIGPPGAGKSYLAKSLPWILPDLSKQESIETGKIYSIAGIMPPGKGLMTKRPFRSPHHTASLSAMTGGGGGSLPGEISLAHNGVLYLDEIAEFAPSVLEVLRQPLEDRQISISRLRSKVTYPANFMMVASMNPCPCGYHGESGHRCICSAYQIKRYISRISGPLLDRMDIQLEISPVSGDKLLGESSGESSEAIRKRVVKARELQTERYGGISLSNSMIPPNMIERYCKIGDREKQMLMNIIDKLHLSARAYTRILKIARTIADLDDAKFISLEHLSEAILYRGLDRKRGVDE